MSSRPSYRILFYNHVGVYSGAERGMLDWARRLTVIGNEVLLAFPFGGRLMEEARNAALPCLPVASGVVERSFRPLKLLRTLYYQCATSWQIIHIVFSRRIHLIHANSFTATLLGVLAARLTRRPLIWHMYDILAERRVNKLVVHWLAGQVSSVICASRAVQDRLVELGVPRGRTTVIYNVVDLHPTESMTADELRLELGLPASAQLVGIVGQIATWKGQLVFLRAAARIASRFPSVYFVIMGEPLAPQEYHYAAELRREVAMAGLTGRVTFTGFLSNASRWMPAFDILVHASIKPDAFPTVLLEALASGSCVVASRLGGVPEIIADQQTGLLVTPNSPEELSNALAALLADPTRRAQLRAEAKRRGQPSNLATSQHQLMDVYACALSN